MTSNQGPVLAFGELLWDMLPTGKVLGGAPANFAYRLSELGVPVAMVSRVGSDELGDEAVKILADKGLSTGYIQRDSATPTGTVTVFLSDKGDANYEIHRGVAYDNIDVTPEVLELARQARAICYGTLVQRASKTRATLYAILEAAPQALKIVDINLRKDCYCKESLEQSLAYSDVLKLNREEVKIVGEMLGLACDTSEHFAQAVMERYSTELVIVTSGSHGVFAYHKGEPVVEVPGYEVKVVDTVGSGDNFTAGFLEHWLKGASLEASCRFANRIGALTAAKQGGMPKIQLEEIENLPEVRTS